MDQLVSTASELDPVARAVARGTCRMFDALGFGTLTEFRLPYGRRVDVIALGADGGFVIAEVKSCAADFRTDRKWREYLPFCDRFYFAVPAEFPLEILPADCGLIVADSYDAVIRRESKTLTMSPQRKRHQLLRFAQTASGRLHRLTETRL